jgi:two-component system, OmpR family, alkaline phosphatase synthesis response regulator PhoP
MAKILVVEDEKPLAKVLRFNLEREGHEVQTASDGLAALESARAGRPDLVILDVMLPKLDGFEVCRRLRAELAVPVLMLTARKEEVDRVLGLELGADDYVTKPFSVRELLARVKAILRRSSSTTQRSVLRAGSIELDTQRYELRVSGATVAVGTKEFDFLRRLLEAQGRALSRDELLEKVWGYERGLDLDTRTVDQHVKRLREKLGAEAKRLMTVKNVGYRLKND